MKGESKNNKKLELNQARKEIFVKAMEETEKIKKIKNKQDIITIHKGLLRDI